MWINKYINRLSAYAYMTTTHWRTRKSWVLIITVRRSLGPLACSTFLMHRDAQIGVWCLGSQDESSRVEPHNPLAIIYGKSSKAHTQSQWNFRGGNRSSSAARAPKTKRQSQRGHAAAATAAATVATLDWQQQLQQWPICCNCQLC